jgi:hypothetical protein
MVFGLRHDHAEGFCVPRLASRGEDRVPGIVAPAPLRPRYVGTVSQAESSAQSQGKPVSELHENVPLVTR